MVVTLPPIRCGDAGEHFLRGLALLDKRTGTNLPSAQRKRGASAEETALERRLFLVRVVRTGTATAVRNTFSRHGHCAPGAPSLFLALLYQVDVGHVEHLHLERHQRGRVYFACGEIDYQRDMADTARHHPVDQHLVFAQWPREIG